MCLISVSGLCFVLVYRYLGSVLGIDVWCLTYGVTIIIYYILYYYYIVYYSYYYILYSSSSPSILPLPIYLSLFPSLISQSIFSHLSISFPHSPPPFLLIQSIRVGTYIRLFILYYSIPIFFSSSFFLFHPNHLIHSIRVGTYITLFIFWR